jgi:predicted nucleic acid-binding protein
MKQYLLDANVLGAYLQGRSGALSLAQNWIYNDEATTSIVVYGELTEYLKSFPDFSSHQAALRILLRKVRPYPLTYALLEQYADLRRAMRPPHGPG